jgi:lysyl-tRNA synthetase class 2
MPAPSHFPSFFLFPFSLPMFPDWQPSATLEVLRLRANLLAGIRQYFAQNDVLEVETPLLGQAGVTDPHLQAFTTVYHQPGHSTGLTLYLQTSPEYAMKRLLAAGCGSIYQITKAFRNEESGRLHNPEFTLLEWYRTGFGIPELIADVEALINGLFTAFPPLQSCEIYDYQSLFQYHSGVDPLTASLADMQQCARQWGLPDAGSVCGNSMNNWLDYLFSERIQPCLGQGRLSFVQGYPASLPSLARTRSGDARIVERVEVFLAGMELGNGYHELTDAVEQRIRFEAAQCERNRLGLMQPPLDERLLAALDYGLPDCAGMAIGVDRLLMARLGLATIDETLCFPVARA